jgi:hypothetical protein
MPQLDKITYGSEVVYLIVAFIGLYLVILRSGLPILYKVFFFRKIKFQLLVKSYFSLSKEIFYYEKNNINIGKELTVITNDYMVNELYNDIDETDLEMASYFPLLNIFEHTTISGFSTALYRNDASYQKVGTKERDNIII